MAALTPLQSAKRVVIKIGSALLVDSHKQVLRRDWLQTLCDDVANMRINGQDVLIVSSGSIALGRQILDFKKSNLSLEESQAAASVGQIALAQAYQEAFAPHQVKTGQILLTSEDGTNRRRYLNTQATIKALLAMGVVPIINENDTVATDEIRFGDNDRLAAQLAVMSEADVLVLLSDVDGVYTANPKLDRDAKHIPIIEDISPEIEAMASGVGSEISKGGMVTKLIAAKTAMSGGVAMTIANGDKLHPIQTIMEGSAVSWFMPKSDSAHARKNWIRGLKPLGSIMIDQGAHEALKSGSSLLPAGCVEIEGDFERGDAIEISFDRHVFARGLVGYDAREARLILGVKTAQIEGKLGYPGRGAMVHRDNLVML